MRDTHDRRTPDLIEGRLIAGYARPSHNDPTCQQQHESLQRAGCSVIHTERSDNDRLLLDEVISTLGPNDRLVVAQLDCLADHVQQLVTTLSALDSKRIGVQSIREGFDSTQHGGLFRLLAGFEKKQVTYAINRNPGGRRPKLGFEKVVQANAMLANREPKSAIARALGVSRTTLYKYIEEGVLKSHG